MLLGFWHMTGYAASKRMDPVSGLSFGRFVKVKAPRPVEGYPAAAFVRWRDIS